VARFLKLAAVGVRPPEQDRPGDAASALLQRIMQELEPVLDWKPELVLLPGACDAPLRGRAEELVAAEVREKLLAIARETRCAIAYASALGTLVAIERDGREIAGRGPVFESSVGRIALLATEDLLDETIQDRCRAAQPDLVLFSSQLPGGMLERYWAFACRAHFSSAVLFRSDLRLPCRIVSPVGAIVAESTNYQSHAEARINLDCAVVHLDDNRERLQGLVQRMPDSFSVHDPGNLGAVLVSNAAEGSTRKLLQEQGVETIDQYFDRYRAAREKSLRDAAAGPRA
jgi:hypothetical protein